MIASIVMCVQKKASKLFVLRKEFVLHDDDDDHDDDKNTLSFT